MRKILSWVVIVVMILTVLPLPDLRIVDAQTTGCTPGALFNPSTGQPCPAASAQASTSQASSGLCLNLTRTLSSQCKG
jgi:hypothetical protein